MHVYDSVTNVTTCLGNTTETYFRISSLLMGHNYTFSVQARCLLSGQLCGEPALLLYNQLTGGTFACNLIKDVAFDFTLSTTSTALCIAPNTVYWLWLNLCQTCANYGPRATSGPLCISVRPV